MFIPNKDECDYVVCVEHTVSYGKTDVDCSLNFIKKRGPASIKEAWEFFHKDIDAEYTNVYGVTNKVEIKEVYRRV